MHPNFVQALYVLITVMVSAATTKELTTDYIDLLNLPSHGAIHSLIKRQAPQEGDAILQENKDFGTCRTPDGVLGHCRHIIYCRLPEWRNDDWRTISHLCIIQGTSIGICCPDNFPNSLVPQIIADKNDKGRIVNHPEKRGCGIATKQFSHITDNDSIEPDERPWMVAFLREGIPYVWCGGALITDRLVLTAAHCVDIEEKDDLRVRLGEYNTNMLNETRARDFRIVAMVVHVNYDPLTYENDIAMVRVDHPTLFNTYIWPVCLPPMGEDWENYSGVVNGWGAKFFAGPRSDILMEVPLPVINNVECQNAYIDRITDRMLCAGVKTGGQDACQGDSGGPLLVKLPNNRWVVIGIVTFGVGCGVAGYPGVYTRTDKFIHWIFNNSDI